MRKCIYLKAIVCFCFVFHLVVGLMQLLMSTYFLQDWIFFLHVWRYLLAIFQTYQCLLPLQLRWKYAGKNEWVAGGEEVSVSPERCL